MEKQEKIKKWGENGYMGEMDKYEKMDKCDKMDKWNKQINGKKQISMERLSKRKKIDKNRKILTKHNSTVTEQIYFGTNRFNRGKMEKKVLLELSQHELKKSCFAGT